MSHRPATAGRLRFDIADIVRQHRAALEAEIRLSSLQRRVLSDIERCRTAALGGHLDVCRSCGHEHPAYNSCRNRHCPKCQALRQEQWIAARAARLLPTRHFHIVFTLPSELRPLAQAVPRAVFDALFAAASATLLDLGDSRLDATLGITAVLHTWTRDLRFHPHLHTIVTAGGLRPDGTWMRTRHDFLFHVDMMGGVFRGKMLEILRRIRQQGAFDNYHDFHDPEAFERLLSKLARARWVVYAKKPFRRSDHVLRYLGRYTHRVAISSSRITAVSDTAINFRTKDGKHASLHPVEFLCRFVQHVLPLGFHKIRHFGLYSGSAAASLWPAAHAALRPSSALTSAPALPPTWQEQLRALTGHDVERCRKCGAAVDRLPLARVPVRSRAPPTSLAA